MNIAKRQSACETCPVSPTARLVRLGEKTDKWDYDYVVALAGNPNTGKSTVFNALTGLRQHTGNWTGKTVARAEGGYVYDSKRYRLVDLPGTYSLLSTSADEQVARDFILFGRPTVTIIVTDATRLERNLNLVLQILEITDRAVIAVNLIDEARRHGIEVDTRALERALGVPVVPTAARSGKGIPELLEAVGRVAVGKYPLRPHRVQYRDAELERAVSELAAQVQTLYPDLPNTRWVAMRLLENDESIVNAMRDGSLGDLERAPTPELRLIGAAEIA